MRNAAGTLIVFLAGFAVMVMEIVGARYLAKDFGSSFYVWVSQIGVVLKRGKERNSREKEQKAQKGKTLTASEVSWLHDSVPQ